MFLKKMWDQTRLHENGAKECIVQISARAFQRIFPCKIWLRYSRERALSSLPALRVKIPHVHFQSQPVAGHQKAGPFGFVSLQSTCVLKTRTGLLARIRKFFFRFEVSNVKQRLPWTIGAKHFHMFVPQIQFSISKIRVSKVNSVISIRNALSEVRQRERLHRVVHG